MSHSSQSKLSRAMQAVWDGISARYSKYSAVEQVNIKLQFLVRASFPNVIRPINCYRMMLSRDALVITHCYKGTIAR